MLCLLVLQLSSTLHSCTCAASTAREKLTSNSCLHHKWIPNIHKKSFSSLVHLFIHHPNRLFNIFLSLSKLPTSFSLFPLSAYYLCSRFTSTDPTALFSHLPLSEYMEPAFPPITKDELAMLLSKFPLFVPYIPAPQVNGHLSNYPFFFKKSIFCSILTYFHQHTKSYYLSYLKKKEKRPSLLPIFPTSHCVIFYFLQQNLRSIIYIDRLHSPPLY